MDDISPWHMLPVTQPPDQNLGSVSYGSGTTLTPFSSSKFGTRSHPRGPPAPDQGELKRHRDQHRRDLKTSIQKHRAIGTLYSSSPAEHFATAGENCSPPYWPSPFFAHTDYGSNSSVPESGMLYQVPPVLPSKDQPIQEAGYFRVIENGSKAQCWEHGCNGRQFSTFSNLLRHQREKSGKASKATCSSCGAEFTRTSARTNHQKKYHEYEKYTKQ